MSLPQRRGRPVRLVARKWPDRPHWEHDAVLLGEDEHGHWLGARAGTRFSRPGASYVGDQDLVTLVPHDGPFVATFYATGGTVPCEVYVDVTTPARWAADTVTVVDLDLDVLRGWSGRVWVDDEDEFADHRVRWDYPDALVRQAAASCEQVRVALLRRAAPYDTTARVWLARLASTGEATVLGAS